MASWKAEPLPLSLSLGCSCVEPEREGWARLLAGGFCGHSASMTCLCAEAEGSVGGRLKYRQASWAHVEAERRLLCL